MTTRIAMWSGPRNISTAMMRAWENRPDTTVIDEPFYAFYLESTGIRHPMTAEVIASQPTDWKLVAAQLSEAPCESAIYYQKHMTHHMLDEIDLAWTAALKHCFLIRDPLYVVNSYIKKRDSVSVDDIGIERQLSLYEIISRTSGQDIPVIDASDFLRDPAAYLQALCRLFEIPFYREMLAWPAGRRQSDGAWASHWYQKVEASTGFEKHLEPVIKLKDEYMQVVEASRPCYQKLKQHCLKVS